MGRHPEQVYADWVPRLLEAGDVSLGQSETLPGREQLSRNYWAGGMATCEGGWSNRDGSNRDRRGRARAPPAFYRRAVGWAQRRRRKDSASGSLPSVPAPAKHSTTGARPTNAPVIWHPMPYEADTVSHAWAGRFAVGTRG